MSSRPKAEENGVGQSRTTNELVNRGVRVEVILVRTLREEKKKKIECTHDLEKRNNSENQNYKSHSVPREIVLFRSFFIHIFGVSDFYLFLRLIA